MRTVFVSGCYDLIHGGHVQFFKDARQLGERLVVCIASDVVLWAHKHRDPILPLNHRIHVIEAFRMVDQVLVGDDRDKGLNFVTHFRIVRPDFLAVTEDDLYEEEKRKLCAEVGAEYVKLKKRLTYEMVSSTQLREGLKA